MDLNAHSLSNYTESICQLPWPFFLHCQISQIAVLRILWTQMLDM